VQAACTPFWLIVRQEEVVLGHNCIATDHSNGGVGGRIAVYHLTEPPSRVVMEEELAGWFLAVKGAVHDLVSFSCISGKKGTPRNQSSNLESSRCGGGFHLSPTLSVARESIVDISGSDSGIATVLEGGSAAKSFSPESSPSYAVIDIRSSGGAP
uniref:Uncharacterized protein n=1 Tax=Cyprinus carpio carpio TaxID=630221 RepID=A0A9J7ZCL8_CYPCA